MSEPESVAALREAARLFVRAEDTARARRLPLPPDAEWSLGWWYEPTGKFISILALPAGLTERLREALGRTADG